MTDSCAAQLGTLLAAFTGEHVGEPRLLVCLYDDPLLHVDLKFVATDAIGRSVDRPVVVWSRDASFATALAASCVGYPPPDAAWIEARFWIWIHYGVSKVRRGELFEALAMVAFLRSAVLGPLALQRAGATPSGVRRLEREAPDWAQRLKPSASGHDANGCLAALRVCVDSYRALRASPLAPNPAEIAALRFLDDTRT